MIGSKKNINGKAEVVHRQRQGMKRQKVTPKSDVNDDSMTLNGLVIGEDTNRCKVNGKADIMRGCDRMERRTQKAHVVCGHDGTEMGHKENDTKRRDGEGT